MNELPDKVTLRCPDCKRQVPKVHRFTSATTTARRKCPGCGQHWVVKVEPLGTADGIAAFRVEWNMA